MHHRLHEVIDQMGDKRGLVLGAVMPGLVNSVHDAVVERRAEQGEEMLRVQCAILLAPDGKCRLECEDGLELRIHSSYCAKEVARSSGWPRESVDNDDRIT